MCKKVCNTLGCFETIKARGLCAIHLEKQNRKMESLGIPRDSTTCITEGCGKPRKSGKLCHKCNKKRLAERYAQRVCAHEGCSNPRSTVRYCVDHAKMISSLRKEYRELFLKKEEKREWFRKKSPKMYDRIEHYVEEIQALKASA